MLLSLMFIPSYTTIYFFVKKFVFSNVFIPVNTIFVGTKYVRNFWEIRVIQNVQSSVQGKGEGIRNEYVRTSCFRKHFV